MSSEDERHRKAAHLASLRRRRWVSKWGWARIRADRRAVGDLIPSSAPVVPVWVATQVLTSEGKKEKNLWSQLRPCEKCQFGEGPSRMRGPFLLGRIRVRKKSCWTKHCGMSGLLRVSGGGRMGNPDRFNAAWIRNWRRAEGKKRRINNGSDMAPYSTLDFQ